MNEQEIRILHLEDTATDALLAEHEIRKVLFNFTIRVVETEDDFIFQLDDFKPHIVISDFQLPSFDGLSALKIILEKSPLTPVIILTGSMNEDTAVFCMKAGAVDYVIKGHIKRLGPAVLSALEQMEIRINKKKAEEDLLKSEEKFRRLFENHTAVKLLIDTDTGNIVDANKAATKYYGWSLDELKQKYIGDIFTRSIDEVNTEVIKIRDLQRNHFEHCNCLKDGSCRNVEVFSSMMEIDGHNFLHYIVHDITEKMKTEQALLQSEENFHRSISGSPLGIRIVSIEGKTIYTNKAFLDIYEFDSLDEFIHTPAKNRFTPESYLQHLERKEKRKAGMDVLNYELSIINKRGEIRQVKVSRKEVLWNGVKHYQLINQDITEQKKLTADLIKSKEKAEESDRLKTAFLHNISHEIRTPMNAIVGFSEFLSNPGLLPDKRTQFIDIIVQSCNQLLSIISDIISIATIEAGQEEVKEAEVNLNSIMRFLNEQFLLEAKNKNVAFHLLSMLPEDEAIILSDETKLLQVLTNLVGNALKFTLHGHVNIGYLLKENEIEFFVEDTGIGIPKEMLGEIFKRFRQVESTTTRQFGGSGLGLSISKAYVELLGGKMWVESLLDVGSTFYFTIPYKCVELLEKSTIPANVGSNMEFLNRKTLLIAEDEDSNFMLLEEILSTLPFDIIRVVNGLEAIETCKSHPIDLVLMDIKMPVMDGYEAIKRIREFKPHLPLIAQTAYTTDNDKDKALACGCNDFISKPFKHEVLISKIQELLH